MIMEMRRLELACKVTSRWFLYGGGNHALTYMLHNCHCDTLNLLSLYPIHDFAKDLRLVDWDLRFINFFKFLSLCPSAHETHEKRTHENIQASVDPTSTTKNLPTIIAEKVLG